MYAELMGVSNMHGCSGFEMHYSFDIKRGSKMKMAKLFIFTLDTRAATIHSPHDTIYIAILDSRYDKYRDTLFRLETISNCMRIILWSSTMVITIFQSLFEMVHSHMFNIFVKVLHTM